MVNNKNQQLSLNEFKELIAKDSSLKIIDVRDIGEYNSGYIKGAINIPLKTIATNINNYDINKNDTIVLYCKSGGRAKLAESFLNRSGFTNVKNFYSIDLWEDALEK
ncbi:MAG: rhodanese-like domain-containing protein [Lachnospirales bacterium]